MKIVFTKFKGQRVNELNLFRRDMTYIGTWGDYYYFASDHYLKRKNQRLDKIDLFSSFLGLQNDLFNSFQRSVSSKKSQQYFQGIKSDDEKRYTFIKYKLVKCEGKTYYLAFVTPVSFSYLTLADPYTSSNMKRKFTDFVMSFAAQIGNPPKPNSKRFENMLIKAGLDLDFFNFALQRQIYDVLVNTDFKGGSKPKDKNFPYFRCPYIGLITTFLRVKPFEEFEGWKDYIKSNYNCNLVLIKGQGEPVIDLDTLTKLQAEAQMFDERVF